MNSPTATEYPNRHRERECKKTRDITVRETVDAANKSGSVKNVYSCWLYLVILLLIALLSWPSSCDDDFLQYIRGNAPLWILKYVFKKYLCVCVLRSAVPDGNIISRHKFSTKLSYGTEGQGYLNIHKKSLCVHLTEGWFPWPINRASRKSLVSHKASLPFKGKHTDTSLT